MALLIDILRNPQATLQLDEAAWDLLIRQARHANLLGRLHHELAQRQLLAPALERARHHMLSAATMAERQHLSVRHEARLLRDTLAGLGLPLILLKGAAYVVSGLPAERGRVFADLDILVPKARLQEVESALMLQGWVGSPLDDYDQRYYRQWMHELPAMEHMRRGTALDVHHSILPPTSRLHPDPAALLAASVELPGWPGVCTLSPCDMVLHSATHLFHEGEPDNLLRDLSDLDLLLRHFGSDPSFWPTLVERAEQLQLSLPLRLALRYASEILATPVPRATLDAIGAAHSRRPGQKVLDFVYRRMLAPKHSSAADWATPWCQRLLYVRSHWLRMPPHLLAYHLAHKALWPSREPAVEGEQPR
ncbi:nucleotidyltransferase domain-containing protein [Paucibacter sp. XJ19-41]|uniref:nucleotidyltransferase domain-containing protein n=1 Tax=Paucibacter sp. XJ19-41 TaxID=2927824 RepID=UPI00234B27B5|nr:nucleotidyltransferase family protein [Paucibacter sp. XJ19-41]MDC6167831.1 nucleotidyltransferase family protein [Paucibacter sp. XJ19-41]